MPYAALQGAAFSGCAIRGGAAAGHKKRRKLMMNLRLTKVVELERFELSSR